MDRGLDNQGNVHGSTFSVCITHVKNDILLHKKAIQCKITSITVSSQRTLGKLQATIFKSLFFPHFLSYLIFTTELHVMSVAAANTVFCTTTQSNSGTTLRELNPIYKIQYKNFVKTEIKLPQTSKYFDKCYFNVILNNLQWTKLIF